MILVNADNLLFETMVPTSAMIWLHCDTENPYPAVSEQTVEEEGFVSPDHSSSSQSFSEVSSVYNSYCQYKYREPVPCSIRR